MKGFTKFFLFLFALVYAVSPIDLCPGPIDDAIVLLCTIIASAASSSAEYSDWEE